MRIGDYELLVKLASGGMGSVHVARQTGAQGFERLVAVKRVQPSLLVDQEFRDMLRDEARIASQIHHPNVVPVIGVIETEDELLLVMEYVESVSLSRLQGTARAAGRPLSESMVVGILCQALEGLHAAHEAADIKGVPLEIVHRDVSPQNIIVGSNGSVQLIDFGIAKAANKVSQTKSGTVRGKFSYFSPEQARGEGLDRRVDIFAMGVVAYEALSGENPLRGENDLDTLNRVVYRDIPPLQELVPDVTLKLADAVHQALARDPALRFETAHDFLESVEAATRGAAKREIAAEVVHFCGSELTERKHRIRKALAATDAPDTLRDPESLAVLNVWTAEQAQRITPPSPSFSGGGREQASLAQEEEVHAATLASGAARTSGNSSSPYLWLGVLLLVGLGGAGLFLWNRTQGSAGSSPDPATSGVSEPEASREQPRESARSIPEPSESSAVVETPEAGAPPAAKQKRQPPAAPRPTPTLLGSGGRPATSGELHKNPYENP